MAIQGGNGTRMMFGCRVTSLLVQAGCTCVAMLLMMRRLRCYPGAPSTLEAGTRTSSKVTPAALLLPSVPPFLAAFASTRHAPSRHAVSTPMLCRHCRPFLRNLRPCHQCLPLFAVIAAACAAIALGSGFSASIVGRHHRNLCSDLRRNRRKGGAKGGAPRVSEQRWPRFTSLRPLEIPGVSASTTKPVNACTYKRCQ